MNLVIDIGNTQIKLAVFKHNTLIDKEILPKKSFLNAIDLFSKKHHISNAILSNVGNLEKEILQELEKLFPLLVLDYHTKLPFTNKYKTPKTLGVDRMALMAAATKQFTDKNVLVFDAGSCITYDFIHKNKEYHGGAISPGLSMRYKSLHAFTEKLPLLTVPDTIPLEGNSTQNAIHIGVIHSIIYEIEGIIEHFKQKYSEITIILTGGDTIFLAKNIKSTIFANPNFLLEGLDCILTYNLNE